MESIKETTTFTDSVVFEIIKEFGERAQKGYDKYGTDMDRTDLSTSDWCQHLREELMDGLVYLTRLKKDIAELEEELRAFKSQKIHSEILWEDYEATRKKNSTPQPCPPWLSTSSPIKTGTEVVYNIVPKPNETYTDEEPVVRKRYGFHR